MKTKILSHIVQARSSGSFFPENMGAPLGQKEQDTNHVSQVIGTLCSHRVALCK